MASETSTNQIDPKTFDAIDAAAFTLGAPALGVYLWLEMRRGQHLKAFFISKRVRDILRIKDGSTLKKYLDQINEGHLARVIFTPRGDSFVYERIFSPVSVLDSTDRTGPEKSVEDRLNPDSEENIPASAEKIGSETPKDFGVGVLFKAPSPPDPLNGLEGLISLSAGHAIHPNAVKLFLGSRVIDAAWKYDSTMTVPGHLWNAWNDALKIDGRDLGKTVARIKAAVLYCIQQKELGVSIKNRIGYFVDAVRRGRTPSTRPDKKAVLEKIKPVERTPDEVEKEKREFWETQTLAQLKEQYRGLVKLGMAQKGRSGFDWLMEGIKFSQHAAAFDVWTAAGCPDNERGA